MKTISSRFLSRQRGPRLVASLLALAVSAGCAVDAQAPLDEDVETSDQAITNAYPDGPVFVVNLGGCSGVAISQNYILTSAHCFVNSSYFSMNFCSISLFMSARSFSGRWPQRSNFLSGSLSSLFPGGLVL